MRLENYGQTIHVCYLLYIVSDCCIDRILRQFQLRAIVITIVKVMCAGFDCNILKTESNQRSIHVANRNVINSQYGKIICTDLRIIYEHTFSFLKVQLLIERNSRVNDNYAIYMM